MLKSPLIRKTLKVTVISMALCLGACGQKGPLVPPPPPDSTGP